MRDDLRQLARSALEKALRALEILAFSLKRVQPFDISKNYDYLELEPYDALADRFVRAVEVALRLMRTIEQLEFAEQSDT